jgi:putative oxidoreductase
MTSAQAADIAYVLLRAASGLLLSCHGAQKIFGAFGGPKLTSPPLMVAAGWIELVAGACVAVGLLTVPMALLASGEMAVGYFKVHAPQSFWPIANKGELAVVLCFVFLSVAAFGAGRYALDGLLPACPGVTRPASF